MNAAIVDILGTDGVLTDASDIEPYLTDHRHLYHGRALAVAMPRTVEQVSRLLAYCNENPTNPASKSSCP
jgi:FAD/FMN-containing dehydrogenase